MTVTSISATLHKETSIQVRGEHEAIYQDCTDSGLYACFIKPDILLTLNDISADMVLQKLNSNHKFRTHVIIVYTLFFFQFGKGE